jgi:hypothetical protein
MLRSSGLTNGSSRALHRVIGLNESECSYTAVHVMTRSGCRAECSVVLHTAEVHVLFAIVATISQS